MLFSARERNASGAATTNPVPTVTATTAAAVAPKKNNSSNSAEAAAASAKNSFLSDRKFTNSNVQKMLSEPTLKAIKEKFGHERLSKVQAYTFDAMMQGKDVFAKSKTGSGKTMAFLLPMVERAYHSYRLSNSNSKKMSDNRNTRKVAATKGLARVHSVIVSPTKELAYQTHLEAVKLLSFAPGGLRAELITGGSRNRNMDVKQALSDAKSKDIAVLTTTPGRLDDHVKNTPGFAHVMSQASAIVLDEADRMLDAGFRAALENILKAMSPEKRQTILVSATMPANVLELSRKYMRPGETVTIDVAAASGQKDEPEARVNPAVKHSAVVASHALVHHAAVQAICGHAAANSKFKIIVFLPFKKQVDLLGALYRKVLPACLGADTSILQLHSDVDDRQRTKAYDTFRKADRAVLLGTDVIARGVDFPDVTFVVQMGLTERETYVHRVGRTGRAGRSGEAVLFLAEFEEPSMRRRLEGFGVEWLRATTFANARNAQNAQNARPRSNSSTVNSSNSAKKINVVIRPELDAAAKELVKTQPKLYNLAYMGWLGSYGSEANNIKVSKQQLEKEAAAAYAALGLQSPPVVSAERRKKMGYPPAPAALASPPVPVAAPVIRRRATSSPSRKLTNARVQRNNNFNKSTNSLEKTIKYSRDNHNNTHGIPRKSRRTTRNVSVASTRQR